MIARAAYVALLGLLIFAGPAKAQFFIEEGKVVLAVSGGDRINKSITIDNTSAEDLDIKVYWEDFKYESPYDGSKSFLPAGTIPGSPSQWISYSPQQLKLPAFAKQKIDYTVSVPSDVSGGHYGVLFFERTVDPLNNQTGLDIVTRVGCLFFIEAKDKSKKASLEEFKIANNNLTGNFVHQGNVVLIPRITYYMMDKEGIMADRGELNKLYVPPGVSAPWSLPLPADLKSGRYTLVVNADLDEGDVVVKEIDLVKDVSGSLTIENMRD